MSRTKWIIGSVAIAFMVSLPCYAEEWARNYQMSGVDVGRSVQETTDGGYIVAGGTTSGGAGGWDFWVLKLNSDGTVAWEKSYGGSNDENEPCIRQTSDGGYVIAGYTWSFGAGPMDFWVLKLNSNGTVAWQKTYGRDDADMAYCIQETSGGGYIVVGESWSLGTGADILVLKLNSNGTLAWQKTYGGSGGETARSVQQTSDGGYIVAGHTDCFGAGAQDFWVLKLNSNGTLAWQKTYGGSGNDMAYSIQETPDGYVVAGWTDSFGAGGQDFWVLKLNSNGTVAWQKTLGGTDHESARSVQQTSDGYVVAGSTNSFGPGQNDFWVLKLNSNGTVAWQKTLGGTNEDHAWAIQQTSDSGYIVAGWTSFFYGNGSNVCALKLDENGEIPSCRPMGTSNATVSDTSVVDQDTTVIPQDSSAVSSDTDITPQDTSAETSVICPGEHIAVLNRMLNDNQRLVIFDGPTPTQGEVGGPIAYDVSFGSANSDYEIVAIAGVDIDGDGTDEIAVLNVMDDINQRQRLFIFNAPTPTYNETGPPVAYDSLFGWAVHEKVSAIAGVDIDGDGIDEIAVLNVMGGTQRLLIFNAPQGPGGETTLVAYDASLGTAGTDYEIIAIAGVDIDGDGVDEVAVLNRMLNDNQRLVVFNAPTTPGGEAVLVAYDASFGSANSDYEIIAIAGVDIDGDGTDEIAALNRMLNDDQRLVVFNAPRPIWGEVGGPIVYDASFGSANSDYEIIAIAGTRQ